MRNDVHKLTTTMMMMPTASAHSIPIVERGWDLWIIPKRRPKPTNKPNAICVDSTTTG